MKNAKHLYDQHWPALPAASHAIPPAGQVEKILKTGSTILCTFHDLVLDQPYSPYTSTPNWWSMRLTDYNAERPGWRYDGERFRSSQPTHRFILIPPSPNSRPAAAPIFPHPIDRGASRKRPARRHPVSCVPGRAR